MINKKNIFILILFYGICSFNYSQETAADVINLVFCGYLNASEDMKKDENLDFSSIRLQFYQITGWGQRIGGFLSVLMSSSELIEEEYEDIYGGLFVGLLLGQELKLWRFTLGVNLLAGAGGSVSTLRRSPRHIDFFSEINVDLGVMLVQEFQIATSVGFQCTGNLFPELPGTDYLLYYPVWGITLSF